MLLYIHFRNKRGEGRQLVYRKYHGYLRTYESELPTWPQSGLPWPRIWQVLFALSLYYLCGLLTKVLAAQTPLGNPGVLTVYTFFWFLSFSRPIDLDTREEGLGPISTAVTQVPTPPATWTELALPKPVPRTAVLCIPGDAGAIIGVLRAQTAFLYDF